ncbi:MAG: PBP1A family penicillin-binding protein [Spirochaetia bacterium]|jgi:penicillin-binding protein 1A|nr:PBP1A family penicillin-binding protein [Spirochaetia bacterium]
MIFTKKQKLLLQVFVGFITILTLLSGITFGVIFALTRNISRSNSIGEYHPSLPSQILDINGSLITEFFSDEKREIIPIDELPRHLIQALITREDRDFFQHNGFSLKGIFRAAWNIMTRQYVSGGSTITQQVAGKHYADRSQKTIKRKIIELWWALQLEKTLSKYEILELYLNESYFGHNTYGVEAASQFYFRHSARDLTIAESVMLVIQLANPARYSPIKYPGRARVIQNEVINQMVDLNYITREEAEFSFAEYWNKTYDPLRSSSETAYLVKDDKAPYFSEYIRQELENILYGSLDYFRDGLVVHTTLDLKYQQKAEKYMQDGFFSMTETYLKNAGTRTNFADKEFLPIIEALALFFDLDSIRSAGAQDKKLAYDNYYDVVNPALNAISFLFDSSDLRFIARMGQANQAGKIKRNTVEGALVSIDNETGYIKAMVGGSDFETKKLNRAVQAKVMPGSAFKPLYYSAAISSKLLTPASMLYDKPVMFHNDDGTPYAPNNFLGEWKGPVSVRYALANSMNIPSIQVLDFIGFDAAINRAARLLGIKDPDDIANTFPRKYPLALGIIGISPMQMAKAFATFPNQGKEVTPIGIRYIEDRNGKIILEPERELRATQKREGERIQIMSPQAAYIMVDMLKSTVEYGTLANRRRLVNGFPMSFGGKTGTTQNWSDAWTVGFSPYMTTAIWFGFDMPGNSLGLNQTGAQAAGPVWARYMKDVHLNNPEMPPVEFKKPGGLVELSVCSVSGMLPTEYCNRNIKSEIFIAGTEPRKFCTLHRFKSERNEELIKKLQDNFYTEPVNLENLEREILNLQDFETLKSMSEMENNPALIETNPDNSGTISTDLLD